MGIKALRESLTQAFKQFSYPGFGGGSMGGTGGGSWNLWQGPVTGQSFGSSGTLPGTDIDYESMAGPLWLNGIVMAALKWEVRCFNEAPLVVRRRVSDPLIPDPIVEGHPLTKLYAAPCPGFNATRLSSGYLLSRMTDGTAYLVKNRNTSGQPVELHYVPHWMMTPRWAGSDYITAYEYRCDNRRIFYSPADVIVLQDGVDPANMRRGLSPLKAVLREVVTDNEAATYSASILRNMGVPGAVVAPSAQAGLLDLPEGFGDKVKLMWGDRFAGDGRGKPLVFDFPIDVKFPNVTPENMAIDKLRSIPVDRVLSVIGPNSTVLHLQVDGQPKFANYKEAREAATEECLIPLWTDIAATLTTDLLHKDYPGSDDLYVDFWMKDVRALQKDENSIATRHVAQANAAKVLITTGFDPTEVLEAVGLPAMTFTAPVVPAPTDPNAPPQDDQKPADDDGDKDE